MKFLFIIIIIVIVFVVNTHTLTGLKGHKGDKGNKGSRGYDGQKGERGDSGLSSSHRSSSSYGQKGAKGERGFNGTCSRDSIASALRHISLNASMMERLRGPPGYTGDRGQKGERGDKGSRGYTGEHGPKGAKGDMGYTGRNGTKGDQGPSGYMGPRGYDGQKGDKGEPGGGNWGSGYPGQKGNKGERGYNGTCSFDGLRSILNNASAMERLRGPKGHMGERGHKGEKGEGFYGGTGFKGEKGVSGRNGTKGEKGEPGSGCNMGSRGCPNVTMHGQPGYPGPKGEKGERGYNGTCSDDGFKYILNNATAVERLRGHKGNMGERGFKGEKGDTCVSGYQGGRFNGTSVGNCTKGEKGDMGPIGYMGPIGPQGYNGQKGEKGKKGSTPEIDYRRLRGEKGDRGLPGEQGWPGPMGPPGPPGVCSHTQTSAKLVDASGPQNNLPRKDVQYKLLEPPYYVEKVQDSYTPGRQSYGFRSGIPIEVDPRATNLIGLNFTAPFIVTAIFKTYSDNPSIHQCLFSINQNDRIVLMFCIQAVGPNLLKVTLDTELYAMNSISYILNVDFKDKWLKFVIYVRNDKADVYVNCNRHQEQLTLEKEYQNLILSNNVKLQLAYAPYDTFKFQGLIEELTLYTNADDNTLKYNCDQLIIKSTSNANFGANVGANKTTTTPLEEQFKKELAECRKEITALKTGLKQQTFISYLVRSEMLQEIETLKIATNYLMEHLTIAQKKNEEIQNELNKLKKKA